MESWLGAMIDRKKRREELLEAENCELGAQVC
jgi:hypothetical protein